MRKNETKQSLIKVLLFLATILVLFIFSILAHFPNLEELRQGRYLIAYHAYFGVSFFAAFAGTCLSFSAARQEDERESFWLFVLFLATFASQTLAAIDYYSKAFPTIIAIAILAIKGIVTYALVIFSAHLLRLKRHAVSYAATVLSSILLLAGAYMILTPHANHERWSALTFAVVRNIPFALFPLFMMVTFFSMPTLRRNSTSIFRILHLTSDQKHGEKTAYFRSLILVHLGFLVILAIEAWQGNEEVPLALQISSVEIAWIPCFIFLLSRIKESKLFSTLNEVVAALNADKARKFFQRYHGKQQGDWAATVGLKTACFVIDHDPHDEASSRLTATISHIRREEIAHFTERLLGSRVLELKAIGNQLSGNIDPEETNRSCIDVLILFASVYLDVVPLVERRLKGLVSLLPIFDDNLAKKVTPSDIEESHSKMEWLYHLDYQWVDQQLILSGESQTYGISIERFNSIERNQILHRLQERNRIGNFIWIGDRAKDKIQMEAPHLSGIIEAWSFELGGKSTLIHLIKFEELIPRLQKYFNLESSRYKIKDFDISHDAKKLMGLMNMQLKGNIDYTNTIACVRSIGSYDWRGFREKDGAIELIVKAYHLLIKMQQSTLDTKKQNEWQAILEEAIDKVGYPSKILYNAHRKKRSIRSLAHIRAMTANAKHPRFTEAWLYACSTDPEIYPKGEIAAFMDFLKSALNNPKLCRQDIVRSKIAEAFFNFARALTQENQESKLVEIANQLLRFLVQSKQTPEAFCYFFDSKIYLEDHLDLDFPIQKSLKDEVTQYLNELLRIPSEQTEAVAAMDRWKILLREEDHTSDLVG